MSNVVERIEADHRNLARVLKALQAIVTRLGQEPHRDDLDRLFDICHYVRVFPDKVHHPREDRYVFEPLKAAAPEHAGLLQRVQSQHDACASMTEGLHEAVKGHQAGTVSADELRSVAQAFIEFQFEHMRVEEREVLPLAASLLDSDTLSAAGEAFSAHGDPLFGENVQQGFQSLADRIARAG